MATAGNIENSAEPAKGQVNEVSTTVTGQGNVPAEAKAKMKENLEQAGYVPEEAT
jgi:hypothetical protein